MPPPSYALFSDQSEALAKMRAGFHTDVVFPCISKIKIWYDSGVIEPLDTSMLSHWDELVPALTTLPTAVLPDGSPLFAPVGRFRPDLDHRTCRSGTRVCRRREPHLGHLPRR